MRKYRLTDEMIRLGGHTLHRIVYTENFRTVRAGQYGGYVESERNLMGNAILGQDACVCEEAILCGNAQATGKSVISGRAVVSGQAMVMDTAGVSGDARVYGQARVMGNARIYGNARVRAKSAVLGQAYVLGYAKIGGQAWVCDDAWVDGMACIGGRAKVMRVDDYVVMPKWWDTGSITWTRSDDMWHSDDFNGTAAELLESASQQQDDMKSYYNSLIEYIDKYVK